METRDYNKEARELVDAVWHRAKNCTECGQWLFEQTAICMAKMQVEALASATAKPEYYRILAALKELEISKLKTNTK